MDPALLAALKKVEDKDLVMVQKYLEMRRIKPRSSRVMEGIPHGGGWLHLETRITPKTETERGPYWNFKAVRDGKQESTYIGKCSLEEAKRRADR